jgi:wyosine [tRNA(Phe)-imidazoG37] synthetase (radical SAM superfamily)
VPTQFQKKNGPRYTYGPVPSRRLGLSLGIDIVPYKVCTYDCVYCQLGKTRQKTLLRKEYTPALDILKEIKSILDKTRDIDYITFSGSGEPTLHKDLGYLIKEVKKISSIPVAVLTNGSLLSMSEVRKTLMHADLVVPTLCAADQDTFSNIHRSHAQLEINMIIEGYVKFREMYDGLIWLEVMLVKGINDKPEQIENLKRIIERIDPDRIHLNTVVRPPSEKYAHPVSLETMRRIKDMLGEKCEIIADFEPKRTDASPGRQLEIITAVAARRPVTMDDLAESTGLHRNQILKYIQLLLDKGMLEMTEHNGKQYYKKKGN